MSTKIFVVRKNNYVEAVLTPLNGRPRHSEGTSLRLKVLFACGFEYCVGSEAFLAQVAIKGLDELF